MIQYWDFTINALAPTQVVYDPSNLKVRKKINLFCYDKELNMILIYYMVPQNMLRTYEEKLCLF